LAARSAGQSDQGLGGQRSGLLGGAQVTEPVHLILDGGVEGVGVGDLELSVTVHGAGEGHLAGVDAEPALVLNRVLAIRVDLGHVPGDRLGDQPVDGREADLLRHRGQVGIDEPGRGGGEVVADGGVRDPPRPPRLHPPALHRGPELGQAVS
jgi:hypothetical protein